MSLDVLVNGEASEDKMCTDSGEGDAEGDVVHVEICQRGKSGMTRSSIAEAVRDAVEDGTDLKALLGGALLEHVEFIKFGGANGDVTNSPPVNSGSR